MLIEQICHANVIFASLDFFQEPKGMSFGDWVLWIQDYGLSFWSTCAVMIKMDQHEIWHSSRKFFKAKKIISIDGIKF